MKANIILTSIACIAFALYSCNNEEGISVPQEIVKMEISEANETAINNFISSVINSTSEMFVYNVQTRAVSSRSYDGSINDCINQSGNCLYEDVVVIGRKPDADFWINTNMGSDLQNLVNAGKVTLVKKYNPVTGKSFYIYEAVENPKIGMVVPISYRTN